MQLIKTKTLCRACLTEEGAFQSIYLGNSDSGSKQLSEMLNSFSIIQVVQGDGLPDQICNDCVEKTITLYLFKLKLEESDVILRARLKLVSLSNKKNSINNSEKKTDELLIKTEIDFDYKIEIEELATFESGNNKSYGEKEMFENQEEIKIPNDNLVSNRDSKIKEFQCGTFQEMPEEVDLVSSHKIEETIKMEELEIIDAHCFLVNCDFDEPLKIEKTDNTFSCRECPKVFDEKEYLENHISSFHENQKIPTSCESDNVNFDMQFQLENKPYGCDICFEGFSQISKLKKHVRTHNFTPNNDFLGKNQHFTDLQKNIEEQPFICPSSSYLDCDKKICKGKKPCKCEMCKKFSQLENLKTYKRTHTGKKLSECDMCEKKFTRMQYLIIHKRTHTGEKPFECDMCGKKFALKHSLTAHKRIHTGEKPFECDMCNKKFTEMQNLIMHKRTHTGEKPFKCDICEKNFAQRHALILHKRTHTGEKPFKCDTCKKKFNRMQSLIRHNNTHTGKKSFECDMCEKKFRGIQHLIIHKRTHTGEKPFECDTCEKKFTRMQYLILHQRTHTGEKPFKCDICKKKFTQMANLITHKRTHTGEKPFECDICIKKFAYKHRLRTHQRTHTGKKPFECDMCNKKFTQMQNLIMHKRTHTGEKPFECDTCKKKFNRMQNLIAHKKTHTQNFINLQKNTT